MADIYKVAANWMSIWVHSGPGLKYPHVGVIYGRDNAEYRVTDKQNTYWLKIGEGRWACDRDSNGMIVLNKIRSESTAPVPAPQPEPKPEEVNEESYTYVPTEKPIVVSDEEFITGLEDNFTISNMRGIFGMPYQFMESADPRVSNKPGAIGRKYAKEVVESMPLFLMTAGLPVFMGEYTKNDKESIMDLFVGTAVDMTDQLAETVLGKDFGKYYSLKIAYNEYFQYVNPMCRIAARIMGVQDYTIDGMKLDKYEWSANQNDKFSSLFSVYKGCTAWYCDSETSISDSWSNGTSPSMIGDKINGVSDYGRELNFLLGTVKADTGTALDKFTNAEELSKNMESVNKFVEDTLGSTGAAGIFKTLTNSIQTVVAGGKIVFPELWSDSTFSRSYNVRLKLVSPDGDNLSIYLNIIVPILHLLGFVLPREGGNPRAYISPFLVRGFYKGLFNVDMGIMTDLNITKGKESAWSLSGVPLTVDVDFTIKDLYNDMYMTNMDKVKHNMMGNIILMDYISNLCGVNINEPDVIRGIDMFLTQNVINRVTDTWHMKIWGNIEQWINNKVVGIFGKF